MFTSSKEYLNLYFENEKQNANMRSIKESEIEEEEEKKQEEIENVFEQKLKRENRIKRSAKIRNDVKKSLLSECIYKVYKDSIGITKNSFYNESVMKSFINNFIDENGVENLLLNFKSKSFLLSEFSRIVNKYTDIICKNSDVDNPDNFKIDTDDKDKFYDELNMDDMEDVSLMIKERVSSAIDDFLSDNVDSKAQIKDIIQKSKEKIESTDNEELKEYYEIQTKSNITAIRESKAKTIFECMVFNLSKSCVVNDKLKEIYTEDGKLNMDKIVESCRIMYTFLETVNTCKMVNVDESYIEKTLDSLNA